jgi:hypothetical protein
MRRQLDASAVRVTELEQLALRHEFRAEQLAESYREALLRVSVLTEEHKSLANGWEIERAEITAELKRVIKEKESEIRILASERDSYRDRLMKSNVSGCVLCVLCMYALCTVYSVLCMYVLCTMYGVLCMYVLSTLVLLAGAESEVLD